MDLTYGIKCIFICMNGPYVWNKMYFYMYEWTLHI